MPPAHLVAVSLSTGRAFLVALAGLGAGIVNGVAGGGTMVSFPALLGLGYPALTANMTSTVGIWPGYVGGVTGFRAEVTTQRDRIVWLLPATVLGAAGGAALLLTTSQRLFARLAPWLVVAATVLFALQPLLARLLRDVSHEHRTRRVLVHGGTFVTSLYGGYFGAGMGVIMLAVFGVALPDTIMRTSGLRAALSLIVNALAALIFMARGTLAWEAVGLLAIGSLLGGWIGSTTARRIPAMLLRVVIIGIGAATAAKLLAG
ncbi:MAG TPA: sulfite exporter TauE/SafE family protein [Acidimicrobiales bacterium]|jgi:uncharacterized membrane protein YfcA|nr:sulfite exporter TauE/SafE family protein [Acidimicrobiales bacterium]